jgi:hypothetical protein
MLGELCEGVRREGGFCFCFTFFCLRFTFVCFRFTFVYSRFTFTCFRYLRQSRPRGAHWSSIERTRGSVPHAHIWRQNLYSYHALVSISLQVALSPPESPHSGEGDDPLRSSASTALCLYSSSNLDTDKVYSLVLTPKEVRIMPPSCP